MITIEQVLTGGDIDRCYGMYRAAFEPMQLLAAARHLFTYDEVAEELRDTRIDKYIDRNERGDLVGLAVMTTDLTVLPWIEPKFLVSDYPDRAADGKIFYLGYVLVHPDAPSFGVFKQLGDAFLQTVADAHGVLAWDACAYNNKRAVGRMADSLPKRFGARVKVIDTQTYYAADFAPTPTSTEPAAAPAHLTATREPSARPAQSAVATATHSRPTAAPLPTRTVTLAERPDLAAGISDVLKSRWPTFMLAGNPGHRVDLTDLLTAQAPQHQILLLDSDDTVLGVGLSVPLDWDGTVAGLPTGWDGAVTASAELLARGASPSMVSALSVTISPRAAGQGHAAAVIRALKAAAARVGVPGLLVPVRPILKPQYPLIPLDHFIAWRTADGQIFDPWLRLHQRLGATVLTIAPHSMTITGSVSNWEDWTAMAFPETGNYTIAGGLVPLPIDRDTDTGTYCEPNVWVLHPGD